MHRSSRCFGRLGRVLVALPLWRGGGCREVKIRVNYGLSARTQTSGLCREVKIRVNCGLSAGTQTSGLCSSTVLKKMNLKSYENLVLTF